MEPHEKEQLLDAIKMSVLLGKNDAARHVFFDTIQLSRERAIEECIELALKKDLFSLANDFQEIKKKIR